LGYLVGGPKWGRGVFFLVVCSVIGHSLLLGLSYLSYVR
jgi:hypothetical protein